MDTPDRVHALDAVRATALLLGIVLHACLSFIPGLGALGWPIVDDSPSVALGGLFFMIHVFRMTLGGVSPGTDPDPLTGAHRAAYVIAYAAAGWLWTVALIGGALRWLPQASPTRRYLADASYWLYLMHLPVVFALQAMVSRWPLPWAAKFALVLAGTLGVLLPAYRYLVRGTVIGVLLNGRRLPPGPAAPVRAS